MMSRLRWNLYPSYCQMFHLHRKSITSSLLPSIVLKKPLYSNHRMYSMHKKNSVNIGIVGAPLCEGQSKKGVELGPAVMRKFGLIERLESLGHDVKDYGDIDFDNIECSFDSRKSKRVEHIGAANLKIFTTVADIIKSKRVCVTLGGDHSMAIGSVLGHCSVHPKICILFVDAHADINTPETTVTGNVHGMAVSFFIKEMQQYIGKVPGFEWANPSISKFNLAYLALRAVDTPERKFLEELNIKYFSMKDIDRLGIYRAINLALESINPCGDLPLHVSFDIDALDNSVAPSTGTAVPGGLTLREGIVIAEEVARSGMLSALDIVEVNPAISHDADVKKTVLAALDIIAGLFYNERAGNIFSHTPLPLAKEH